MPTPHVAISRDLLVTPRESASDLWWVKARSAAEHSPTHMTGTDATTAQPESRHAKAERLSAQAVPAAKVT